MQTYEKMASVKNSDVNKNLLNCEERIYADLCNEPENVKDSYAYVIKK